MDGPHRGTGWEGVGPSWPPLPWPMTRDREHICTLQCALLSISIASGALMVRNICPDRLSVGLTAKCIVAKRLIESGCHLGC